ncbi:polynucleotide kinase [Sinorhizobium meliloti]|nr:polynucleotide kinase [Sinorhizobium meliloti]
MKKAVYIEDRMKKAVIFDIDGTIADVEHRRGWLRTSPPDWERFNAEMGEDRPNLPVVELYRVLWNSKQYEMVLTSGRFESSRRLTETWLIWNEIPFGNIYMRQDGDNRADHLVKEDFLAQIRARFGDIAFAVDDRDQVVAMWRRNGITCLQCAYGSF